MSEKSMINDMTSGNVIKQLLAFSFPFMLSNLLQTIYSMVDMIVIGQFVGSAGLSAVSIGSELLLFCTFIGMGFGNAAQILISQYVGLGDKASIQKIIGTAFTFMLALSIVVGVAGIFSAEAILKLLNTPPEAFDYAVSYVLVCFSGTIFIFGYNLVSSILRGMGDSKRPFMFIAIAAVTNLVLDLLFVAVFDMAAFGAALATVIGQAVSFIASIIYLSRRREAFGFDFKLKSFAIEKNQLRHLVRLGIPMSLQLSAIIISVMFVISYINAYGVVVSAVNGIGSKLGSITGVVTNSIGSAMATLVGQNMGAGKPDRVSKLTISATLICLAYACVLSIIMFFFPDKIFSLFDTNPEVLAMASVYMPVAILNFFGFASRSAFGNLINGIGFASLSLVIGLLDSIVFRVGLSIFMGITLDMGIMGFWYGSVLAGYVPTVIGGIYFLSGKWKTRKLMVRR